MKKQAQNILAGIIVSILIFVSLISVQLAYATDIPEEDVYYYEYYSYTLENGEATIISANRHNLNVTVPSEVDGYPVVAIAENAYDGVSLNDEIVIPETIKRIEPRAFAGANIRGNLYIFQGLEEIGEEAFKDAEIEKVYFAGTEEEFSKINIAAGNESIFESEMNYKFDLSKHLFESSVLVGLFGTSNSGKYLLIGLLAPVLLIVPPLGIAAFSAPAIGVTELVANITYSLQLFASSIEVLFM